MVSSIGYKLNQLTPITGFGIKRHYNMHHVPSVVGRGVVRNLASSAVRSAGHHLVDKLANAIKGGSYKISGAGRKRRTTKTRKVGSGVHKDREPRKHLTMKKHRIILF